MAMPCHQLPPAAPACCSIATLLASFSVALSLPQQPVSLIVQGYPRGRKQLIGPFNALFGPADAARWFELRGVALKTEADGRMFPTSDDSQTVIDCLEGACLLSKAK